MVLVATIGSTAHFGLYPRSIGLDPVGPCSFVYCHASSEVYYGSEVVDATYSTRSWIFQGQALARRAVYFGSRSLTLLCQDSARTVPHEELQASPQASKSRSKAAELTSMALTQGLRQYVETEGGYGVENLLRCYSQLIEEFSERKLSYPEDIERSFAGFSAILANNRPRHVTFHILPAMLLPYCLFWQPKRHDERFTSKDPTSRCGSTMRRSGPFPTYSWSSWPTAVCYNGLWERGCGPWDCQEIAESGLDHSELETASDFHQINVGALAQHTQLLHRSPGSLNNQGLSLSERRSVRSRDGPDVLHFNATGVSSARFSWSQRPVTAHGDPTLYQHKTDTSNIKSEVGVLISLGHDAGDVLPLDQVTRGDSPSFPRVLMVNEVFRYCA